MAVRLYGNVNGTYQKPNIDLFEMAKQQNNQPVESFTNRLSRAMQDSYVQFIEDNFNENLTIEKKGEILLKEFREICDEITLLNTSRPFLTTAAAVSSHELSIANMNTS